MAKRGPKGKHEYWLTKEGLSLISGWARAGLTDEQISENMDIGTTTLYRWKNEYEDIRESLKASKAIADQHVINALYKRACGFDYDEKTYERVWNGDLEKYIKVNTKTVTKMVVPDTTAQIYWLKNRIPKDWRDKPIDTESSVEQINQNILSLAELIKNPKPNREIPEDE